MNRILLIEDEENLRTLIRLSLEKMGYAVTEARDGVEALALFNKRPVELVLTDLMMPEKEGLETIRELRKSHPKLKIIAMSGGGRTDARDNLKMAKLFGATTVFSKPFSLAELGKAVSALLPAPDKAGLGPVAAEKT
jgi:DNA-binding response OmpR family regulator